MWKRLLKALGHPHSPGSPCPLFCQPKVLMIQRNTSESSAHPSGTAAALYGSNRTPFGREPQRVATAHRHGPVPLSILQLV